MTRLRPSMELDHGHKPGRAARACDHPGCGVAGEFKAPRSRDKLGDFYWFCLDHVRAYNQSWDYYRGMSEQEIERERRRDVVGQRPTWPMGPRGAGTMFKGAWRAIDQDAIDAALRRLLGEDDAPPPRRSRPPTPEEEAFKALDLAPGASIDQIKARYKSLVKQHHPDANGGDKAAEERLKSINQAYTLLKSQAFGVRQAPSR